MNSENNRPENRGRGVDPQRGAPRRGQRPAGQRQAGTQRQQPPRRRSSASANRNMPMTGPNGEPLTRTQRLRMEKKRKQRKRKRIMTAVLSIVLVFGLIIGAVALVINSKLNQISYEPDDTTIDPTQEFYVDPDETIDFGEIDDAVGNNYKAILKDWATNGGEKMSSKNVLNILLIGSDASAKESGRANSTDKGNTDVIMMVSVDKLNKKLKLTSFMRDSYTYLDGFERYAKINAACSNGGASYLVETIENDYKIHIDGYAMVDFDSFREVIDILGGVRVNVPKHVAKYINVPAGDNVLLNSEQALAFCRVRYSDADGDISRVARQREVINSIINQCKSASLSEINGVMDAVLNNVKTNISKKSILSYATQAVTNGWAGFELIQTTMPVPEARAPYSSGATGWIWIVDYPLAAQKLQMELYGETNITLKENRKTAISVMGLKPQG